MSKNARKSNSAIKAGSKRLDSKSLAIVSLASKNETYLLIPGDVFYVYIRHPGHAQLLSLLRETLIIPRKK